MRNLASCLPKRVQRYAIIYLPLLVIAWLAWRHHLGPKYAAYRQELRDMDAEPPMSFGKNSRPHFKDMIQLHTLDERHLPHGNKRLVIVGDVHGCIGELKDLLKKVDFDKHRDHLILTGDIVSKGKTRRLLRSRIVTDIFQAPTPPASSPSQNPSAPHASAATTKTNSSSTSPRWRQTRVPAT